MLSIIDWSDEFDLVCLVSASSINYQGFYKAFHRSYKTGAVESIYFAAVILSSEYLSLGEAFPHSFTNLSARKL